MIISIFGFLFIRNGIQVAHQTHAYILLSVITFCSIVVYSIHNNQAMLIVLVLGFTYWNQNGLLQNKFSNIFSSGITKNGLTFSQLEMIDITDKNTKIWEKELKALSLGEKIYCKNYEKEKILTSISDDKIMQSITLNHIEIKDKLDICE